MSGVNIDVRTIYLSRDYKKDYRNYRQKFLDEWEKRHREFLQNLMKKETLLERIIINRLIPMKIEIKDIKIVITDTVTTDTEKKICLNIANITSYGCNSNWEPILQQKDDMENIRRLFKVNKINININENKNIKEEDFESYDSANCFVQPFNFDLKVQMPRSTKYLNLRKTPKFHWDVSFDTPLVFDMSISKLKFLIGFFNYLTKIKKVEKYWIHRPEIKDEKCHLRMPKSGLNMLLE